MATISDDNIVLRVIQRGNARFNKGIDDSTKKVRGLGGAFSSVADIVKGNLIADGIQRLGSATGGLVRQTASLAIQAEQTRVSFETFLGSAERAQKVLEDLNQFSLETPFTPDQVNEAGKALLAFGVEQENLIGALRNIGDLSAGTGKNFNELAVIYGKARVQGTLFAEDINQLTEAGIPILGEFAKQFGVTEGEVKKLGSQGKISFANLEQAFQSLTGEGGKFFELTLRQSQTVGGLLSTLQGAFGTLLKNIGETFLPLARQVLPPLISGMFRLIEVVRPLAQSLSTGLGQAFDLISQAAQPVITSYQRLFQAFGQVGDRIREVLPAGNSFAGVITFISNAWETLLNAFSRVLEFEFVQQAIAGLVGILVRIPAVFNGVLEAGKQLVDNLGNRFVVLGLQAERLSKQIQGVFDDAAAAEADALERRIEQLRGQRESIVDAFREGFDDVVNAELPEPQAEQIRPPFQRAGSTAGKEFAKTFTETAKEEIEREKVVVSNILSLEEQEQESKRIVEAFRDKLRQEANKQLVNNTPITLDLQPQFGEDDLARLREETAQLAKELEDEELLVKIFGKDPAKSIQELFGSVSGLIDAIGEPIDLSEFDSKIERSTSRLEQLQGSQIEGAETLANIEQQNIIDLEQARADAAQKQERRQKALAALQAATNVTQAISTILSLYSDGLLKGLAGTAAVIGGITTLVTTVKSLSSFHTGIERVGDGLGNPNHNTRLKSFETLAVLDKEERVVNRHDNKQLLKWGVMNKDLVSLVGLGLGKLSLPQYQINKNAFATPNNSFQLQGIKELKKEMQLNNKYLKNLDWGLNVDGDGFSRYTRRFHAKSKALRAKR